MSFNLSIKNFGKLIDADLRIGKFTVFAGPNNTGKSYVSKLLYSLFDVMNADHALMYFNMLSRPIRDDLERLSGSAFSGKEENAASIVKMESFLDTMGNFFDPEYSNQREKNWWDTVIEYGNRLKTEHVQLLRSLDKWAREEGTFAAYRTYERPLERMGENVSNLHSALTTTARDFTMDGIKKRVAQNLSRNFQTGSLSNLINDQTQPAKIVLDNVGEFTIENTRSVNFSIDDETGFRELQEYSRVIYLESPLYWKLKSPLEEVRMTPRFRYRRGREALGGVPGYFYDLIRALKVEYPEEDGHEDFKDLYERLTSKDIMDGRLMISETGDLQFEDNKEGVSLSLNLVAMGVVNLGILALLIERRIIDEGSFLFIDEPGAHLHPAWQVKMAKTLLELSRLGVNVVIATHSMNILKFLEVEVKEHPEYAEQIELNRFSRDGIISRDSLDFNSQISKIMKELTTPFAELYYRGL